MATDISGTRLRLWLRLLAATNEMERALRRRLRTEFGTTLPRFDVMAALDRAPEGLSMSELSRRLMVTNGNTTVLVGALEKDGLVRRSVSAVDRRSFTVELTDAGRKSFACMADIHAQWVSELLSGIDAASARELSRGLHHARLAIQASAGTVPAARA
jgi:DNA-binding MarR family transcriptional regulator